VFIIRTTVYHHNSNISFAVQSLGARNIFYTFELHYDSKVFQLYIDSGRLNVDRLHHAAGQRLGGQHIYVRTSTHCDERHPLDERYYRHEPFSELDYGFCLFYADYSTSERRRQRYQCHDVPCGTADGDIHYDDLSFCWVDWRRVREAAVLRVGLFLLVRSCW
jgi:hypothetical protein